MNRLIDLVFLKENLYFRYFSEKTITQQIIGHHKN